MLRRKYSTEHAEVTEKYKLCVLCALVGHYDAYNNDREQIINHGKEKILRYHTTWRLNLNEQKKRLPH